MLKKDLIISLVAHLVLIAAIAVINPISAMFRPKVDIIIVKTYEEMGGGAKRADPEPANIAPPKSGKTPDEVDDTPKIKEPEKKAAPVEKPKEKPKPKPKPKPEPEKRKDENIEATKEESKSTTSSKDNTPKINSDGGIEVNEKVGGTGAGTGTGSGSGNLPYNIGMVLKVIERNWRNVVTDVNPITCTVYFQIDRYGYVVGEPVIEKSSGMTAFDQGCVLAIKRAGQFPAFPASFDYQYIGLHLDFEYVPGM